MDGDILMAKKKKAAIMSTKRRKYLRPPPPNPKNKQIVKFKICTYFGNFVFFKFILPFEMDKSINLNGSGPCPERSTQEMMSYVSSEG